ncbi:MAG TPA: polysaccharide pyruvyl transferase family protein [Amycolatopsis sp.]|nr:polysaccharide pyruvyl transferase family protein [Amycolatopsis sp.]
MTPRGQLRVGFCGILGSGNLGNDGSLDAVVSYLRKQYPDASLGFFCMGPETVAARYGAPAAPLQWYEPHAGDATGLRAAGLKVLGKLLDPFRTLAWIRRYDVVIVPGMGVLEATLPLRPWAFPYSLFWLGVTARLTGTKVALVSVGSNVISKRATRWVIVRAARLAHYRSFRDSGSREAMREMGVDVRADEVYPDLAFALSDPPVPESTGTVGVGLMAFYGGNDDRARADEIHDAYLATMKRFVRWLVDQGRRVRLFTGDQADDPVVAEILSDVDRPDAVTYEPAVTLHDLMRHMAGVDTVVATRYHNVLCALKLGKPTVSLGYAAKNEVIMDQMGLREFCQNARSLDFDRLVAQFTELEKRRDQFADTMAECNREHKRLLDEQFAALSAAVLDGGRK